MVSLKCVANAPLTSTLSSSAYVCAIRVPLLARATFPSGSRTIDSLIAEWMRMDGTGRGQKGKKEG
ncbi:16474_t:CDS:2 [Acaulospora colombiana]|uniref:16474_t:CDS:1 n=1 Tax=Acaulospora colombiana TaxID=27376 RepID=A0ACA9MD90_9GLOM|nr:16474_t:CDS:2 [Acaulospora colombiana]